MTLSVERIHSGSMEFISNHIRKLLSALGTRLYHGKKLQCYSGMNRHIASRIVWNLISSQNAWPGHLSAARKHWSLLEYAAWARMTYKESSAVEVILVWIARQGGSVHLLRQSSYESIEYCFVRVSSMNLIKWQWLTPRRNFHNPFVNLSIFHLMPKLRFAGWFEKSHIPFPSNSRTLFRICSCGWAIWWQNRSKKALWHQTEVTVVRARFHKVKREC